MTNQVPGIYRRKVGSLVVTAVNDGFLDLPLDVLLGIAPEDASAILVGQFRRPTPRLAVNAYVVQGGGRTVLIDTGANGAMGADSGHLLTNLAAAGIQPADVDLVLLTHFHPDHSAGLIDKTGAAAFPTAALAASAAEAEFWLDQDPASVPEGMRPYVQAAQAAAAPYRDRMTRLGTQPAAPGITPVPLPGHTPGHTGFRIDDGDDSLVIWGDVMHVPDIQAARPEVGMVFDVDPQQAEASRRRMLDMVATDRLAVAGMHLHFPGFAHVARAGQGFAVVPEAWFPGL